MLKHTNTLKLSGKCSYHDVWHLWKGESKTVSKEEGEYEDKVCDEHLCFPHYVQSAHFCFSCSPQLCFPLIFSPEFRNSCLEILSLDFRGKWQQNEGFCINSTLNTWAGMHSDWLWTHTATDTNAHRHTAWMYPCGCHSWGKLLLRFQSLS